MVLGAGLDTFAHRRTDLVERLRIFEVDRPAAQAWKRERLQSLGIAPPSTLSYAPVDFETDHLGEALAASGFDPASPAVVSWMAVTQYLGREAIDRTLRWAASLPATSRLVLTYVVPPDQLPELARAGLAWTMGQAGGRGEPFLSLFRPGEIAAALRGAGFRSVELVEDAELRRLYLRGWPDAPLTGIERMAVAQV